MHLEECVRRNLALVDRYLAGECQPTHRVHDLDTHRSLLFPDVAPEDGTHVTLQDEKTGKLHGVGFALFSYSNAPYNVLPIEALIFDPEENRAIVGAGYIRRISKNSVQIGFLESMTFDLQDDAWVKSGHEVRLAPSHPLVDSAMASWKFDAHMRDVN